MNAFALEDSRPCRSIEDLKQTQVRLTKTRQTLKLLKDENFTKTARIGTLRYPGRGLGGRQPEVNSQGLEFNLHKCHATRRPPRQLRRRLSSFWRPLRKVS